MTKQNHNALISACAALLLPLFAGLAAQAGDDGEHRHHGPPPAAFEACQGKKADDVCKVTFGDHAIDGKCAATPDARLACRPDRPMGPPPELFKACEGKHDGDACTVTLGDKTRAGTCGKGRGDALICRP
jgi:hypothetical protein